MNRKMKRWGAVLATVLLLYAAPAHGQFLTGGSPPLPALGRGAAAWADYDGDGLVDLYLCGVDSNGARHAHLLRNNGTALVPDTSQSLAGVSGGDAAWNDIDGDGDPDLVVTGELAPRQSVTIIYRNVNHVLQAVPGSGLPGLSHGRVAAQDMDLDGDADLVLTGFSETGGFLAVVARNDGSSGFVVAASLGAREWTSLGVGDCDYDGLPDIALGDKSPRLDEGIRTRVWRNLGGMRFDPVASQVPPSYAGGMDWGDLEGDGDLDLLVCGRNAGLVTGVWRWQGGQLIGGGPGLVATGDGDALWTDLDADGDMDIVVAGRDGAGAAMRVYRNTGGGAMTLLQGPSGTPPLVNARLRCADWNADGHPDLVVTGEDAAGRPGAYIGTWSAGLQRFIF